MPLTVAENENNDMFLGPDGNIVMYDGIQAVAQLCKAAAETLLGEMIFDTATGIPYFEEVFTGVVNFSRFEASLRTNLSAIDGVMAIENIELNLNSGIFSYSVVIVTIYGFTQITGDIPLNG